MRWKQKNHRWLTTLFSLSGLILLLLQMQLVAWEDKLDSASSLDMKLMQMAKEDSEIMSNLTHLSDHIGPRLTGSHNLKRANDWAAEKMKSYGLENVRLEAWELPVQWERGHAYARIVEPDNGKTLHLAAMGWTPSTKGKVVGPVVIVRARNPEELKAYKGKLKNAIVLRGPPTNVRPITDLSRQGPEATAPTRPSGRGELNRPQPTSTRAERPRGTSSTRSEGTPPQGTRPQGFDQRADRSGFMAFRREMNDFFINEGVAVLLQDAGKPHGLLNMTGNWRMQDDRVTAAAQVPTAFIAHEHYSLLYRLASRPEPERTMVEIDIQNKLDPTPIPVYNTVGEIRGSEKPDEFVVLGAHIDSWDLGQGTTDNGTGTCVVLEAARIIAKSGVKPKRTIRFVLFSGEEQGLHGSRAYVRLHREEMNRTSAALIHDTGTGRVVALPLQGREKLKGLLENEFSSLKQIGVTEMTLRSNGGSDHQSFEAAGVPGFMFQQDPAEYRLTHHSQSDTLDKAREEDLIQGAQVMAVMAMRIANLEELLPREK